LPIATRAGRAYVVGPELGDAVRACHGLSAQHLASTICFWNGEADGPRQVAGASLAAVQALAGTNLDCYLSIKAPALGFDPDLLVDVLEHGRKAGIGIHFDSLSLEAADQTFALLVKILPRQYPNLGCTLPGRWRRSLRDADLAVDLGLKVRVVKGQWADPTEPDIDLRSGFLAVVDRLAGRARHVAVATHDVPLACEALRRLLAARTPCELELLFGLPARSAIRAAQSAGVPVRCYIPYGHGCLPYCISQARHDPRILLWIARDLLLGGSFRLPGAFAAIQRCAFAGSPNVRADIPDGY
jgi:proline dehydrogenase